MQLTGQWEIRNPKAETRKNRARNSQTCRTADFSPQQHSNVRPWRCCPMPQDLLTMVTGSCPGGTSENSPTFSTLGIAVPETPLVLKGTDERARILGNHKPNPSEGGLAASLLNLVFKGVF